MSSPSERPVPASGAPEPIPPRAPRRRIGVERTSVGPGYVQAASIGWIVGVLAGGLAGAALMRWGPGSNDPLAGLWLVFGVILTIPAGMVVGLVLVWGRRQGRFATGVVWRAAALGGWVEGGAAVAVLWDEVIDEWFNLPVFAGMGAAAGAVTSVLLGTARRARPSPPSSAPEP